MRLASFLALFLLLFPALALGQSQECPAYAPVAPFGGVELATYRQEIDSFRRDGAVYQRVTAEGDWYVTLVSDARRPSPDIVTRKLRHDGTLAWQRVYSSEGTDAPAAMLLDSDENVYVLGYAADAGSVRDLVLLKKTGRAPSCGPGGTATPTAPTSCRGRCP